MPPKTKRIGEAITAPQLAVISHEGTPLGVMTRESALSTAEELEMDLVEIGEQDGIPLCKIMDYGKFLFKQQKSQSVNKTQSRKADLKTLKLTYKIEDHDLNIRRMQAEKFSAAGHPLKIYLQLK